MPRPATSVWTKPVRSSPTSIVTNPEKSQMSLVTSEKSPAAAGQAADRGANAATTPRPFILTTACPDTTGIVAGISGFLASHNALITEAQHYDDPYGNTSFMRTVFHDNGKGMPSMEELDAKFSSSVGRQFNMKYQFHEVQRRCRVLLAVSRHGHCLNSILHRWSTGTLPIEVVAVASNHQDMRSLAEWHGVPYHYLPIIDGRKAEQEQRLIELFERTDAELLVLARYMQILTPEVCRYFEGRAININLSILLVFNYAKVYHQTFTGDVNQIGTTAQ